MFGDVTFAQAPFASLGGNTFSVSASETATAADSFAISSIAYSGAVAETSSGQDAQSVSATFVATQAETATASNVQTVIVSVNASIAETVNALSTFGVVKIINVSLTGVQLTISIGGVLVWAVIDDSQTPNWQNITNTQGSGWTQLPS